MNDKLKQRTQGIIGLLERYRLPSPHRDRVIGASVPIQPNCEADAPIDNLRKYTKIVMKTVSRGRDTISSVRPRVVIMDDLEETNNRREFKMLKVIISPALNGWIVEVGCTRLVAEDKGRMLSEISRYIDDPKGVMEEYRKASKNPNDYPCPQEQPATPVREQPDQQEERP